MIILIDHNLVKSKFLINCVSHVYSVIKITEAEARVKFKTVPDHPHNGLMGLAELLWMDIA